MSDTTDPTRVSAYDCSEPDPEPEGRSGLSRRRFMGGLGLAAAGGLLAACSGDDDDADDADVATSDDADPDAPATTGDPDLDEALQASDLPEIEWDMATSWPLVLDTIYGGAEFFGERVAAMTGGRFQITAAPGGELVPALEILQSIQTGAVESGHTASYYYVGLDPITQLSTCVPFGMTARGHLSWMYQGGGLELIQGIFRERFNVVPLPAGNTGCQMGGWFNKEINSLADIGGLRMRIPGAGGEAMSRLGASVQVIPGGEIYQSLETGAIDAAEWVGPYDDLNQEFNQVTQFYYYPGWWEPGPSLDVMFPADAYDGLPEEYQAVLQSAASHSYAEMLARYDALNPPALQTIVDSGITVLPFPDDVMNAASEAVQEIIDENSSDEGYAEVMASYNTFRDGLGPWFGLAEKAMLDFLAGESIQ
jgi:TRAP-type mannitol/chloroaromatic compound transport system substrate-binding protein